MLRGNRSVTGQRNLPALPLIEYSEGSPDGTFQVLIRPKQFDDTPADYQIFRHRDVSYLLPTEYSGSEQTKRAAAAQNKTLAP